VAVLPVLGQLKIFGFSIFTRSNLIPKELIGIGIDILGQFNNS